MLRTFFVSLTLVTALILSPRAEAQVVVAHRGSSHDAPENTLAAFELAWEQGSDGIEGDFYLTADNEIVCIHDKDTKRTTGVDLNVESSNLKQLRELDAGSWKAKKWSAERIPTFEEVFRTVPAGGLFVIELKSDAKIAPVLARELGQLDTSAIEILVISFNAETILACKQLMPTIRMHWLTGFKQSTADAPWTPTAIQIAKTVRHCDADGVGMKGIREAIDGELVAQLKAGGCREFHVWTIDSPSDARYYRDLGAIGITTNRPEVIGPVVRSRRVKKKAG